MNRRVLIIGAGAAGLSAGLELLGRGFAVTILNAEPASESSSWAGGGILSPLLPWDYPDAVTRLALRAMRHYRSWLDHVQTLGGGCAEYWVCGLRVLDLPDPRPALAWCLAKHMAVQDCGPGVLELPEIAQARNPRLLASLRLAFLAAGGNLIENCPARGIERDGRRFLGLATDQGRLAGDFCVISAGAYTGADTPALPHCKLIRPIRGQMLLFRLPPGTLDTILYRDGLYVIPRLDGHILVGSTIEDAGFDKSTDVVTAQRLHRAAAVLLPALAASRPIRHWAGLRPGSPDNIPLIGRHPDYENVYFNTGHYRYGLTMAPASAELLADLMTGKPPALDPSAYSWDAMHRRQWRDTL